MRESGLTFMWFDMSKFMKHHLTTNKRESINRFFGFFSLIVTFPYFFTFPYLLGKVVKGIITRF